jgi:phage gp36-like protein
MSAYCTLADLYKHGLPRGGLPNPGRLVADVDTGTEILTLDGHGFAEDEALIFRAEGGGSLPAPLVEGTTYYAIPLTQSTFSVSATEGGAAVNLTTAGSRIVVVTELPVAEAIGWASAMVDDFLIGHVVPLDAPYPVSVVSAAADLAIARLLESTGAMSEQLEQRRTRALDLLKRWSKGTPIRGAIVPAAANVAVVRSLSTVGDARGWSPVGGTIP